jgi:uncharacterized membrane protein (UPF0127 family)
MNTGTVTIGSKTWNVNVATTQAEIAAGFSGIPSTPVQTGILFNLGQSYSSLTINMQLMLFPLDIAFIDSAGIIVNIARSVQPLNDFINIAPSSYFLEVNAGELIDAHTGDAVIISDLPTVSTLGGLDISLIVEVMLIMMVMNMMMETMK